MDREDLGEMKYWLGLTVEAACLGRPGGYILGPAKL